MDHPRMRGEKVWDMMLFLAPLGSPPHARGKADMPRPGHQDAGITPACAGKRRSRNRKRAFGRDHPRMRGEKAEQPVYGKADPGSPPHARGKVYDEPKGCGFQGITPACAGKRSGQRRCTAGTWDHPRMRGEKTIKNGHCQASQGSPPHARGKVHVRMICACNTGITPACAGKSDCLSVLKERLRDHPRMRGEKCYPSCRAGYTGGSPPHARGKGDAIVDKSIWAGITPACAGKSNDLKFVDQTIRDHPRMRGEKA